MSSTAENEIIKRKFKSKEFFNYFFSLLLLFYIVIYPPYIFAENYINPLFRISIEFIIVLYLLLVHFLYKRLKILLLLFLIMIFIKIFFVSIAFDTFVSRANKILIFLLIYKYIEQSFETDYYLKKIYIFFVWILMFQLVIGFFIVNLMPSLFKYHLLIKDSIYPYYGNYIFGNFIYKYFGGLRVPRMCGFFTEPGILASFLGLNLVFCNSLILPKRKRRFFILMLCTSVILTFSFTGIIAIISSVIISYSIDFLRSDRALKRKILLIFFTVVVVLLLLISSSLLLRYSSINDRIMRYIAGIKLVLNMNLKTFLFGYGIGFVGDFDRGFGSGILNLVIEQGFLYFGVLIYIIKKVLKDNYRLLVYVIIINLAFDFFAWPLFWFSITIVNLAIKKQQMLGTGGISE